MVFDLTKGYVPEVYSDSRDYRVFLRLLGVICTSLKYDIDNSMSLYNPKTCPANLLPMLANMVGYKYNESLSEESNRVIIENFPTMIRNKGSETGIKLASLLSLQTTPMRKEELSFSSVYVDFDYSTATIYVYYDSEFSPNFELLEKVRPVGTNLVICPSNILRVQDYLYIQANGTISDYEYDRDKLSRVYKLNPDTGEVEGESKVNFGIIDQDS